MVTSAVIIVNVDAKITTSDSTNNSQKINIGTGQSEWNSTDGTLFGPVIISNAGLPIELMDFSGKCLNSYVQLNWSTATELNNDYFLIERSSNATEWQFVSKIQGNGTTGSAHHYTHSDYEERTPELIYYRLSQVDKDKTTTVFKAIDISCSNDKPEQMVLFSNPASSEINLLLSFEEVSPNSSIKLFDNMGQIVMDEPISLSKGLNSFTFPIDISPGTYHVLFSSDKLVLQSQKLLIIK
jgi:hypothetical protein